MSAPTTTVAVITIVSGRHEHLRNQQLGLAAGSRHPDVYVVVAMDDPPALQLTETGPLAGGRTLIVPVALAVGSGGLPLAAARNAGAMAALAAGADTLIFLDVDCVPSPPLVDVYAKAVAAEADSQLTCGVVRYLDAGFDIAEVFAGAPVGIPHQARPNPEPGSAIASKDWQLFWSLSFAVSASTWHALGGFCEQYTGYGAEDTDLGYQAHLAGVDLRWIGGADAYHQYHPTERPPVRHLHDIVGNAGVFHARWGFWPMTGWLTAFRDLGLAEYDSTRDTWAVKAATG
jgi:N-acetylglucosaminyl-diphospho-decaprenol L-rhamnosyltransferase